MSARVALLSNPRSTGNATLLPAIRAFCAADDDIFHYEVEEVAQIGEALRIIARVRPQLLVINGGDGTVQATLTELYHGGHFGETPPPVAVLPNGKTNLIALDLGAVGKNPLVALRRVMALVRDDMAPHIVPRELIALSHGGAEGGVGARPVLGMFLGGAGLADAMLYCRNKLYPTGLPNGLCHVIATLALILSLILGVRAAFLPPGPSQMSISLIRKGRLQGRFALLIVTTLTTMLLNARSQGPANDNEGALRLMLVDHKPLSLIRGIVAGIRGRLGKSHLAGVHIERDDEIRIEGERSSVILDGELFQASAGRAIVLKPTAPVPFLHLAAA